MKIDGFDWDLGNSLKNDLKRGITREEIEQFFKNKIRVAPDLKHSATENRYLAIGLGPNHRPMFVAFTIREKNGFKLIRPISARFMHQKEIEKYEKTFND